MRRALHALACTALIVGAIVIAPAEPIEASPSVPDYFAVTIRMHSFNMCSKDCDAGNGVQARDLIVYWDGADPPWATALQETCRSDMVDIVNRTGMAAGNLGYATLDHSGCAGSTASLRDFGNAIIRSGSAAAPAQRLGFPTQEHDPCSLTNEGHNCRNAVCVPMNSAAGVLNVCSAHMSSDRDDFALPQANEYIYIVNSTYPSGGKFMMGDFNLTPGDIPTVIYSQ